jgi:hypothetical protein
MIEGLKTIISGPELAQLCENKALYHEGRVSALSTAKSAMSESDPGLTGAQTVIDGHNAKVTEFRFIGSYIKPTEAYLLSYDDLLKLGVAGVVAEG